MDVLSGRVFGIFPSYPLSLHGYCLRSLECAEGACIVRRPSYMHHPPTTTLLRINPVHLILALFVLREPLRPGPRPPSIPAPCIRSYDFAPLRISAWRGRDRLLMERKEETEMRRDRGGGGAREGKVKRKGDKESTKPRGRRGPLQPLHSEIGGCFKQDGFEK